jgi:hypothetical protein
MSGLIFQWPPRGWFSRRLLACFMVSIAVHGFVFILFQVSERDRVTSPVVEKEVTFLSSEVPGHQALLVLVEAETPMAALAHPLLPAQEEMRPAIQKSVLSGPEPLAAPRDPDAWSATPLGWGSASGKGGSR